MNLSTELLSATKLIIDMIITTYMYAMLARVLMQFSMINYFNPMAQLIVKVTNVPLRLILRQHHFKHKYLLVSMLLLTSIIILSLKTILYNIGTISSFTISKHDLINLAYVVITTLINDLSRLIIYCIIISGIISWFNNINPALYLFKEIVEPLCQPFRKLFRNKSIDLSPILLLISTVFLQRITIALITDLFQLIV